MNMDELFANIANIGFPIAISCYLLTRVESKIADLTGSINELSKNIEKYMN
ncbi:putative membrane protein [Peptoniphilus sp. ING2-D1G]|nr:putative membrane protein [Peptoniphilus sp. ING2-D1G]